MEQAFILIMVGLTSAGGYILGIKGLRLPRSGLWPALGKACECVGLALVCFLLNLAVGTFAVLAVRSVSGRFVSIYLVSDITLLIVSALQALIFQAWREEARHRRSSEAEGSELAPRRP